MVYVNEIRSLPKNQAPNEKSTEMDKPKRMPKKKEEAKE